MVYNHSVVHQQNATTATRKLFKDGVNETQRPTVNVLTISPSLVSSH